MMGLAVLTDSKGPALIAAVLFFVLAPAAFIVDALRSGVAWSPYGMSARRAEDGWWFWAVVALYVFVGVVGIWLVVTDLLPRAV